MADHPPAAPTRLTALPSREARISPTGFIAQRFPEQNFNGHGHWILTYWTREAGLNVQALSDAQVSDWVPLTVFGQLDLRSPMDDRMSEAVNAQRQHIQISHAVSRTGWTRQQWVDDAYAQFRDLHGSVLDLVNGHISALLAEVDDLRDQIASMK